LARQPEERVVIAAHQTMLAPPALPYDAEVEWISTGQDGVENITGNSPYVDTGVDSANDVGFEIDITRVNDVTWDAVAFGTRLDSSSTRYFVGAVSGGKYYWGWNGRIDSQTTVLNSRHRLGLNFQNSRTATFDDASVGSLSGTIGFSKRLYWPVYNSQSNAVTRSGRWHYHGVKISKGSTVVLDTIPVRIGTTAYWYDRISKTIMETIGIGSFVYGPDK
jgi:hypothetical protein